MPIFENFRGPEVSGSSSYQKNIGAKFTYLYIPSLCKEFFVMRHNLGHPNMYVQNSDFKHLSPKNFLGTFSFTKYVIWTK